MILSFNYSVLVFFYKVMLGMPVCLEQLMSGTITLPIKAIYIGLLFLFSGANTVFFATVQACPFHIMIMLGVCNGYNRVQVVHWKLKRSSLTGRTVILHIYKEQHISELELVYIDIIQTISYDFKQTLHFHTCLCVVVVVFVQTITSAPHTL